MRVETGPAGPDLKAGTSSGAPGARDASLGSAGAERCMTSQRAHEAARTSPAEEVVVHTSSQSVTSWRAHEAWHAEVRRYEQANQSGFSRRFSRPRSGI